MNKRKAGKHSLCISWAIVIPMFGFFGTDTVTECMIEAMTSTFESRNCVETLRHIHLSGSLSIRHVQSTATRVKMLS